MLQQIVHFMRILILITIFPNTTHQIENIFIFDKIFFYPISIHSINDVANNRNKTKLETVFIFNLLYSFQAIHKVQMN